MYLAANYEVVRAVQEGLLVESQRARNRAEARRLRRAGKKLTRQKLTRQKLTRQKLNRVAVGVGVGGDSTTPGLGRWLAQAGNTGSEQVFVDSVEIVDRQVDHDPKRVA